MSRERESILLVLVFSAWYPVPKNDGFDTIGILAITLKAVQCPQRSHLSDRQFKVVHVQNHLRQPSSNNGAL